MNRHLAAIAAFTLPMLAAFPAHAQLVPPNPFAPKAEAPRPQVATPTPVAAPTTQRPARIVRQAPVRQAIVRQQVNTPQPVAQAPIAVAGNLDCPTLIAQTEARRNIPRGLLMAIAVTESAVGGRPNPYAMNIAGRTYHANGFQDMANVISANWSRGVKSIDVGCMQVNLMYHGEKFSRLTDLLDPATNVNYGATYLISLATSSGSWKEAVMSYHNKTNPSRRSWYGCKVWNNYLRVSGAQTGFIPCDRAPAGSSTAAVGPTSPIVIAGYNAPDQQAGPLRPATNIGASSYIDGTAVDIPVARRTGGSLTIVGAGKSLPDVVNDDPRADAFRSVRPVSWSDREQAGADAAPQPAQSFSSNDDQNTGFGRVTRDND